MGSKPIYHPAASSPLESFGGRKLILNVTDDLSHLYTRYQFFSASGYAVLSASDAAQALDLFGSWAPDLVVLNYDLPQVGGEVLADAMKKHTRTTPIVMVLPDVESVGRCFHLADDFVLVSDTPAKLVRVVRKLLAPALADQFEP